MSSSAGEATDTSIPQQETPQSDPPLEWAPLVLTEEKIDELWEKVKQFPQAFDDSTAGNKEMFLNRLMDPRNVFIDIGNGVGLAAGFNVKPKVDMVLHLLMFDRRLRGREKLLLDIMAYFFKALKLRRMTAMVTEDSKFTINLVERMGFKCEGIIRKALLRGGKYLDVHVYGMLSEEMP